MGVVAFVLINCELGSEASVIEQIKPLKDVTEIRGTFGAYDIIVRLQSESVTTLREYITHKIRKLDKIRSTLTLMETNN
jgi:DNA-binding Lrp family transcriptional regulator